MAAAKTKKDMAQAIKLFNNINAMSFDSLNRANAKDMKAPHDTARSMADHLDSAIAKVTRIDGFRHYKFKKCSGLCTHNLGPILDEQVA